MGCLTWLFYACILAPAATGGPVIVLYGLIYDDGGMVVGGLAATLLSWTYLAAKVNDEN